MSNCISWSYMVCDVDLIRMCCACAGTSVVFVLVLNKKCCSAIVTMYLYHSNYGDC